MNLGYLALLHCLQGLDRQQVYREFLSHPKNLESTLDRMLVMFDTKQGSVEMHCHRQGHLFHQFVLMQAVTAHCLRQHPHSIDKQYLRHLHLLRREAEET